MSQGRRTTDRRRRVLYWSQAVNGPSTAASRREAARLREARRPAEMFGSRVRRQLRARWFGLVPVRRRTMSAVVGSIIAIATMLCTAHYCSVAWPTLADQGEIARPLRLDRPDSFGRWFVGILMLGSCGASLLVYQLRRHRLDDFRGHYRLWRLVLIVMLLASLNSVVSLIDWTGALLDAAIGKRVALSGADWIRIVVSLGGAVLAIRLIAEVRRSRPALVTMLAAAGFLAIPEAVKWNFLEVTTIERWALVTSAPMLAFTALFLSFAIYLRMLYRQARRLDETDLLKDRFQQMRLRVFRRGDSSEEREDEPEQEPRSDRKRPKRWWRREPQEPTVDQPIARKFAEEPNKAEAPKKVVQMVDDPSVIEDDDSVAEPKAKRRWFGLRRAKPTAIDQEREQPDGTSSSQAPVAANKPSRFSMRLKPAQAEQTVEVTQATEDDSEEAKPKRRFGLGAFRKQRQEQAIDHSSNSNSRASNDSGDDQDIDPEGIDWNGLSKSERRRLRKQLKRQGDAA